MRSGIGFSLLFIATLGSGLQAQSADEFGRLQPGQMVRVRTVGKSRFVTRLGGVQGDAPTELFARAEVPFDPVRVDSLWIRGRATWTGAIVGGAIMTPLAFLAWAEVCDFGNEFGGCEQWGLVTGLALGTGAAGALLGAGVGALIPKWRLRYARERDAVLGPFVAPGRVGVAVRF
ncbi:MAG: hypothetical protein OEY20_03520 [Gemmatimonadota bacterium]|nr:hypothetical protein [Gemmatimonadota bacterium]MDH4351680.1 hypothetical protein [Gemmatimonadota bacterium]MDH5196306.1 hypothetical protein [Gemmatimonadota bacterium]